MNRQATAVANYTVTPDRQKGLAGLDEASEGFMLLSVLQELDGRDKHKLKQKAGISTHGSKNLRAFRHLAGLVGTQWDEQVRAGE